MSNLTVIRGPAALPPDVEQQFVRAHGRQMTSEERKFLGLPSRKRDNRTKATETKPRPKAA